MSVGGGDGRDRRWKERWRWWGRGRGRRPPILLGVSGEGGSIVVDGGGDGGGDHGCEVTVFLQLHISHHNAVALPTNIPHALLPRALARQLRHVATIATIITCIAVNYVHRLQSP